MDAPIRVLLLDDDALLRSCLAAQCQEHRGLEVVGEAAAAPGALAQARALQPDVVVLDPRPRDDGPKLVARLLREAPACAVLILTLRGEGDEAPLLLQAGARGYLRKDSATIDFKTVRRAIRRVHRRELVIDPDVADRVLARLGPPDPVDHSGRRKTVHGQEARP